MVSRLSQSEMERIRQFANTPTYEREPEMLAPDGEGEAPNAETRALEDELDA